MKIVIWFTGLSGSGKTTLSRALKKRFDQKGIKSIVLDGDIFRAGLCKDLGFSIEDRKENIRRVGEVCKLLLKADVLTIAAFISPFKEDRDNIRRLIHPDHFIEIFCDAALADCELRDMKGLYKRARAGEIKDFTGIDSIYEKPESPELTLDTVNTTVDACIEQIESYLSANRM